MGLTLFGEVKFDGSGIQPGVTRGVNAAVGELGRLKSAMIGALGIASIEQMVQGTIQWASKLRDTADNLGVNVEWLQKMQNGAALVGASIDDVAKFIGKMNQSRQLALQHPDSAQNKAFGRMGMSQADIAGLSTMQFFDKIAASFKNGASTQAVNDASIVGGKSARNLIAAFATQFQNDVPVLSEQMIDALDDSGDAFTNLKTTLMVDLAPAIILTIDALKSFVHWIQQVGAAAGAATSNMHWKDIIKLGVAGPLAPIELLKDLLSLNFKSAGQAASSVEEDQKKNQAGIDAAIKAQRDARHRRENGPPGFEPIDLKPLKKGNGNPYSDAFTAVGNFLGSGRSVIQSVAEQHLQVAKDQLNQAQKTNTLLQQIMDTGAGMDAE